VNQRSRHNPFAVNDTAGWSGALQMDAAVTEADAFGLKHIERTAEHLILCRDESVAAGLPAVEHVTRQAGTIG
jgi:hypothetical protein